ncbi:uracil-DNA glycosylase family protein [Aliikangiella sp. IMCC44359]|uniref:uracil-DNA glycosylase family protein n=1 Tax=Aliikangiella sp. IMCC44359 TaxID=3459125 RepID=UPI00403B0469
MTCKSFIDLKADIQQCQICEAHLPLGPNPVFRAEKTAKILVAGQAPGIRVHESSIPFNDPSGVRLRQWMGIDEGCFYDEQQIAIVPMGFCYPGTGKSGDLPPRSECAKNWHPLLLDELCEIKLILAIGLYAQKFYLKNKVKKNLTETVKAWESYLPEIIPLPHPSPRNNIWLKKNLWFEKNVVPELQLKVAQLLK